MRPAASAQQAPTDSAATSVEAGLLKLLGEFAPQATGLSDVRALSGGASQETWSFDVVQAGGKLPCILRRAGVAQDTQMSAGVGMATEAKLMALAQAASVPVPRVLYELQAQDGLGSGYIMDRIEGETLARKILRDAQFAAVRPLLAAQCGTCLAHIHGIDAHSLPPLRVAPARVELAHYRSVYQRLGQARPVFELALRWLHHHLPPDPAQLSLVHGDFRNGNLIIGTEGINAVLDWELAHLGDPMEDLAWLCVASWRFGQLDLPVGGFGLRDDLYAAYEAHGGRPVHRQHAKFWEVLGTLKWGLMCQLLAQSFTNGSRRTVERAAIGRRSSETEIDLMLLLAPKAGAA